MPAQITTPGGQAVTVFSASFTVTFFSCYVQQASKRVARFFVDAALFTRIAAGCNPASETENTLKRVRVVSGQHFSAL